MSPTLSVYTDGIIPLAIRSVYTDGSMTSVDTDRIADGLYNLFGKLQRCGDVDFCKTILPMEWPTDLNRDSRTLMWHFRGFFQTILPTEWPTDSNRDSCTVTWHFHHRNHRWNHRQNVSVADSICKSHYIPTMPTILSSSVSPSSSPSSFPYYLSPPKLQPTTHPNSPLFSTQALKFLILLYVVTISVLVDFIIFCK